MSHPHILVACVTIPHFVAHVVRQQTACAPAHPLVVATHPLDRATVIAVCPLAATRGLHTGMSVWEARRRCPAVHVAITDQPAMARAADRVEGLLLEHTDGVERRARGGWTLPLRALGTDFAHAERILDDLRREIVEATGWPCALGAGANRLIATVAAQVAAERAAATPLLVLPGAERAFLAPLPIALLPGAGEQTVERLARLGITTVGQLAQLPAAVARDLAGPHGPALRLRAQGLDDGGEVRGARDHWQAAWRFDAAPCSEPRQLRAAVRLASERVGRALRLQNLAAGQITVQVTWTDGRRRQATVPLAPRGALDVELARAGYSALDRLLHAQRLGVQQVMVLAGDVGPRQAALLAPDDERPRRCQSAVDHIKARWGSDAILVASLLATPLPDQLRAAAPPLQP